MKNLFILFIIVSGCSTIENSKPVFDKYVSRDVPKYTVKTFFDAETWKKTAKKGKVAVMLQSQRGKLNYSQEISDILTEGLKKLPEFTDVYFYKSDNIDIWSIDDTMAKAKKDGAIYLLIVSYYDNNSASLNTFHAAFKTATFNLYDFVPVFTVGIGTFNHYYAATLEATLVDLSTGFFVANWQATMLMEKFARGGNKTANPEDIYINDAFRLAASKLVVELSLSY